MCQLIMEQFLRVVALLLLCVPEFSAQNDCTAEGTFPIPGSPEKFYVCSNVNGELSKVTLNCPNGNSYSPSKGQCVANVISKYIQYSVFPKYEWTKCLYNGMYCTDCNTMRICISDGTGKYIKVRDVSCPNGTTCSTQFGQCIQKISCAIREFRCTDVGIFPDPYDCRKVHACFNNQHLPSECPMNEIYDSASERCTKNAPCTRIPDCNHPFEAHALKNSSIFYICMSDGASNTIAPEFYKCPLGSTFNEETFRCEYRGLGTLLS